MNNKVSSLGVFGNFTFREGKTVRPFPAGGDCRNNHQENNWSISAKIPTSSNPFRECHPERGKTKPFKVWTTSKGFLPAEPA